MLGQIYDRENAPPAATNRAFRNSLRARLRSISSQRVRQHYNEDGAERNVVGEASLLPPGARRTVPAGP